MVISNEIQPVKTDCYTGDLVQYKNKVCMIIEVESDVNKLNNFGLLCLSDDFENAKVIALNMSLWEIQTSIQGILVKQNEIVISKQEERKVLKAPWENYL